MQIEVANSDDCRAIAEIHVASWQEAYTDILSREYLESLSVTHREKAWCEIMAYGTTHVLVARRQEQVIGFVSFGISRDPDAQGYDGEISAIYVQPDHWSTGAGFALWTSAKQSLLSDGFSRITLWVISSNERAIEFYTAVGFREELDTNKHAERGGVRFKEVRYVYESSS